MVLKFLSTYYAFKNCSKNQPLCSIMCSYYLNLKKDCFIRVYSHLGILIITDCKSFIGTLHG